MKLKKLFTIASTALLMVACSSKDEMSWEDFSSKEAPQLELTEVADSLLGKTISTVDGKEFTIHYTITCNVKVESFEGNVIKESQKEIELTSLNEQNHNLAVYLVKNLTEGGEVALYLTSNKAKNLGWIDDATYPVVKATISCSKAVAPSWTISLKGQTYNLTYRMDAYDIVEQLGTPYNASNNYVLELQYKDGKTLYMLLFEDQKLFQVSTMDVE